MITSDKVKVRKTFCVLSMSFSKLMSSRNDYWSHLLSKSLVLSYWPLVTAANVGGTNRIPSPYILSVLLFLRIPGLCEEGAVFLHCAVGAVPEGYRPSLFCIKGGRNAARPIDVTVTRPPLHDLIKCSSGADTQYVTANVTSLH